LSGARKYRIGMTLAHHNLQQLQRDTEVASAVMSHPFTRIVFKVGDDDAKKLAEGFSYFEAKDLRNLEAGQAVARVERSDYDFNLSIPLPVEPDKNSTASRRQEVITASRKEYGTARADIEAMLVKSRETMPTVAELSKVAGVPKIVEKPLEVLPPIIVPEVKPTVITEVGKTPRDLGKGGEQHKAIQRRIKEAAEMLGFRSVIEKQIAGNYESVDLLLERGEEMITCEISVTTTIDHEVGNVAKCLKAGLPQVAIICVNADRLEKIAAAVSGSLGSEAAARVSYFQPDQFIAHLAKLKPKTLEAKPAAFTKTTTIRRGFTVTRKIAKLTDEEQKAREDSAHQQLAALMKRK
jgi:hypothetical protein